MAQTTQSGPPSSHVAGDSLDWTDSPPDGASGDANLRAWYCFKHVDSKKLIKVAGTSGASSWSYSLAPEDTANAAAGLYKVFLLIEGDGTRTTLDKGTLTLEEPPDREEAETHAAKMVRLLEAHIEGRIDDDKGRGIESYTIDGVPIAKLTHESARSLLVQYRLDLKRETEKRRAELGLGTGRRVLTHFA